MLSTSWLCHTLTGGIGGLTNGALVSFDYRRGTQGRGSNSVSKWLPSTSYLLPFTVDQGKLKVIVLDGFIRPAQRREYTLMVFLFMAGSVHVSWRYIASAPPAGPAAEATGTETRRMDSRKKRDCEENPPRHRTENDTEPISPPPVFFLSN